MVWNIVASIGGAVLGGIARNKAVKKQNALNAAAYKAERGVFRARFEEIRDDAERGGFNPLTALRAGALSAYGNPSRIPETAQSGVALQAAQAGLQAWAQAPALAREKERFELETQLIRENILSSQAQRKMLNTKSVFGSALQNTVPYTVPSAMEKIDISKLPPAGISIGQVGSETLKTLGVSIDSNGEFVSDRGEAIWKPVTGSTGRVYHVPAVDIEWDNFLAGSILAVNDWAWRQYDSAKQTIPKLIQEWK